MSKVKNGSLLVVVSVILLVVKRGSILSPACSFQGKLFLYFVLVFAFCILFILHVENPASLLPTNNTTFYFVDSHSCLEFCGGEPNVCLFAFSSGDGGLVHPFLY